MSWDIILHTILWYIFSRLCSIMSSWAVGAVGVVWSVWAVNNDNMYSQHSQYSEYKFYSRIFVSTFKHFFCIFCNSRVSLLQILITFSNLIQYLQILYSIFYLETKKQTLTEKLRSLEITSRIVINFLQLRLRHCPVQVQPYPEGRDEFWGWWTGSHQWPLQQEQSSGENEAGKCDQDNFLHKLIKLVINACGNDNCCITTPVPVLLWFQKHCLKCQKIRSLVGCLNFSSQFFSQHDKIRDKLT